MPRLWLGLLVRYANHYSTRNCQQLLYFSLMLRFFLISDLITGSHGGLVSKVNLLITLSTQWITRILWVSWSMFFLFTWNTCFVPLKFVFFFPWLLCYFLFLKISIGSVSLVFMFSRMLGSFPTFACNMWIVVNYSHDKGYKKQEKLRYSLVVNEPELYCC